MACWFSPAFSISSPLPAKVIGGRALPVAFFRRLAATGTSEVTVLQVRGLSKSFGATVVLDDVTFDIGERDRVALVGANGAGKTTLLKALLGEMAPDRGSARIIGDLSAAYLPQDARCSSGQTLHDEMLSVFASLLALEERQRVLEARMRSLAADDPELMSLVTEHAHWQDEFARLGGFTVEAEIGKVTSGLGFAPEDGERIVDHLSGGWQTRVALAKLLLQHPGLLLLDEPTNHLDVSAIEWLEGYLKDYQGSFIVVSHDRYFMDRVADRTLELADAKVVEYPGNYSAYSAEKARRREAQQAAFERQQEYLERQRAFVDRFRATARRAAQAQSREKMLERMDRVEAPQSPARGVQFRFPPGPRSGREVLTLKGVAKRYGEQIVFSNCALRIERGDHVALVGDNGAGKSTLLRLMAGLEKPDKGWIQTGLNVHRSYYAQHQAEALDEEKTVFEEVYSSSPAGWTVGDVRSLLGRFLFSQDEVFKRIGVLSGGERARVALAKMLLRPSNLLLLDEPTSHLDLAARETLETALRGYEGSLVLVSHDRYLIDRVATRVVEMANESIAIYDGNYSYYVRKKASQEPPPTEPPPKAQPRATSKPAKREHQRASAGELERVEREIASLEVKARELETQLAEPDLYTDAENAKSLVAEYERLQSALAELNARWEELALRLESA